MQLVKWFDIILGSLRTSWQHEFAVQESFPLCMCVFHISRAELIFVSFLAPRAGQDFFVLRKLVIIYACDL